MSWDPYVKNLEQGKGRCKYAGIYSKHPPYSPWAESTDKTDFPITAEDVTNVIRIITNQDMNVMASGLKIGGRLSFTCLRLEPNILICQGKGEHKDYSLVITLSAQACIIGCNSEADVKVASVRDAVEQMRDHLCAASY